MIDDDDTTRYSRTRVLDVVIRGPYRNLSGYGRHTRAFIDGLSQLGQSIGVVDVPAWLPSPMYPARAEATERARVAVHMCMPHQLELDAVNAERHVLHTMFEASRVSPLWLERASQASRLLVPTESSRAAFVASGFPTARTRLSPLGVDTDGFHPGVTPLPLLDLAGAPIARYRHRFLHVADLVARKNLPALFRVWKRATKPGDDAILVVKVGASSPSRLVSVLRALDAAKGEGAPIVLANSVLPDEDMPRLFAAATTYMSLSFGEGWDQPMMEAATTGLGLVAPRSSAYLANLDDTTATLLPVTEEEPLLGADPTTALFFAGSTWWRPDEDAAVAAVRTIIASEPRPLRRCVKLPTWREASALLLEALE